MVYAFLDDSGNVLSVSNVSRTVAEIQGKSPTVTTKIENAPGDLVPKSDTNPNQLCYHQKTSGDGTDISHYDEVEYLVAMMIAKITKMSLEVRAYIISRYDEDTQSSLAFLSERAIATGKTNRAAHIAPAIDWVFDSVLTYFYARKAAIAVTTTKAALDAESWDFSTFDASDPVVTIENSLAILD